MKKPGAGRSWERLGKAGGWWKTSEPSREEPLL